MATLFKDQGLIIPLRWDNANDVSLRLQNTVVMYNNKPVYVSCNPRSNEDLTITVQEIGSTKAPETVHSSSNKISFKFPKLGYMNISSPKTSKMIAAFVARAPARKQRQGLSNENVYVHWGMPSRRGDWNWEPLSRGYLSSKPFSDMLMDVYPSFQNCIERLKSTRDNNIESIAFNKRMRVAIDDLGLTKIYYLNTAIGWRDKGEEFNIPERFSHYVPLLVLNKIPCNQIKD